METFWLRRQAAEPEHQSSLTRRSRLSLFDAAIELDMKREETMCLNILPDVNASENGAAAENAFADRVVGMFNGAAVTLMLSIGHRTGLFDAMSQMAPATSAEIAARTGLNERYVREWLGAMVAGRIVEFDAETRKYALPAEHVAFLTRAAVPNNLAATAQWLAVLGQVEDKIVDCFRNGGGVPYSHYKRFHQVMAEESEQTTVSGLFDSILPLVPGLQAKLESGIEVLDVGCGCGRAIIRLAAAFPNSRFTGYDLSAEATAQGNAEAEQKGLSNVRLEVRDVTQLGQADRYDLITAFDAIHDQADPAAVLRGIQAALKPGGTFLMQDIRASSHVHQNVENPLGAFIYTISCMHCMTVSLAQGGAGLGAAWGEELALEMLGEAGFRDVQVHQLPHDILNNYYVMTKQPDTEE